MIVPYQPENYGDGLMIQTLIPNFLHFAKRKDFNILIVNRTGFVWTIHAKHETDRFFEIWKNDLYRVFVFGKFGIGIMPHLLHGWR